ncbi:MAG: response regulator [Proteobacteria bacterium]|nr:response regulator [Pseudomonadota bacterium]MBU1389207.1 response regulator [Pseudomonadota bacterium]MBU1543431.1 response regulator [Pseudomonadota bacterium]MBU2480242.1 response regulator [Pseudomonadota bacterium]
MTESNRLLIVDDNEDILSTFYEFFNSMGYEVKTAVDGFAALKLLRDKSNFFDCLITDLVMPNISGVGLISIVKKEYPHLKIIAMTGYGDQPGALASEAKADVVLFKPIDLFKIENTVSELINQEKEIQ